VPSPGSAVRSRRPYRLTAPVVREHPLQAQIARVLAIEIAPAGKVSKAGVVWWSIDHANYAGEVPGVRIGRGIIAGIPDLFVLWRGLAHLIEIKAEDGELTDAQRSVIAASTCAGVRCAVVRDWIEVLACLDQWDIPRKRCVREAA
jgi:hypothetical protein